ncbi:MAG: NrfD/PsrC family molybdoenzyme membrane anchor subunit [Thiobacillaceae bacterium]
MHIVNREIEGRSIGYWALLGALGLLALLGLIAAFTMEYHGHIITGMNNQIVWGLPHVFAVFMIVAASGALNVASIGTVFGKKFYKPMAPLSALLAISLLAGGLTVLMLDLGRADRVIVAATYYNPKSVFAWNVLLYTGFFGFAAAYLWTMMDRTVKAYNIYAGFGAFVWRLVLTTGTGSIFGFLIARQAFGSGLIAPMFIVFSLAYGTAVYMLVLFAAYSWSHRPLGNEVVRRLKNLLGIFLATSFFFVVIYHMTSLYYAKNWPFERFVLMDGGLYTALFWIGQVLIGHVIPMILVFAPATRTCRMAIVAASGLAVLGALAQMYVTIIGSQAFPLDIFPGYAVSSSFYDSGIHEYNPSHWEFMLGLGGLAVALAMVTFAVKILRLLPESLADDVVGLSPPKA